MHKDFLFPRRERPFPQGTPRGEGRGRGLVTSRELDLSWGPVPRGTLQSELHGSEGDGCPRGPWLPEQRRLSAGPLGDPGSEDGLDLGAEALLRRRRGKPQRE